MAQRVHVEGAIGQCGPDPPLGASGVPAVRPRWWSETRERERVLDRGEDVRAVGDELVRADALGLVDGTRYGRHDAIDRASTTP